MSDSNKPSLKVLRQRAQGYFLDNIVSIQSYQLRPYTVVIAQFEDGDGMVHEGVGFSKVCRPDKWNRKYGYQLALEKAASNAAKELGLTRASLYRRMEKFGL